MIRTRRREILQEQSRLNDAVEKWKKQKNNLDDLDAAF